MARVSPALTRLSLSTTRTGSYRSALSAYDALASPHPHVTLYAARCHLALTPPSPSSALSLLSSLPTSLDSRAVTALAQYLSGKKEDAVSELEELLAELGEGGLQEGEEGRMCRAVIGTVWILEGEERREEGVEVLREGVELGQDQEWYAFPTHFVSVQLANELSLDPTASPSSPISTSPSLSLTTPRPSSPPPP